MTVWVVELCYDYEGCEIQAIFSSVESALKEKERLIEKGTSSYSIHVTAIEVRP